MKKVELSLSNFKVDVFSLSKTFTFNIDNHIVKLDACFNIIYSIDNKFEIGDYSFDIISVDNKDTTKLNVSDIEKYFNINISLFVSNYIDSQTNYATIFENYIIDFVDFKVNIEQKLDEHLKIIHSYTLHIEIDDTENKIDKTECIIDNINQDKDFYSNDSKINYTEFAEKLSIHNKMYSTNYQITSFALNENEHKLFAENNLCELQQLLANAIMSMMN